MAISPTAQVGEPTDVMREDEVALSLPHEAALRMPPARERATSAGDAAGVTAGP